MYWMRVWLSASKGEHWCLGATRDGVPSVALMVFFLWSHYCSSGYGKDTRLSVLHLLSSTICTWGAFAGSWALKGYIECAYARERAMNLLKKRFAICDITLQAALVEP
jgi:hypothetical protein